jgi:superfamily II DNA or RNA helicase
MIGMSDSVVWEIRGDASKIDPMNDFQKQYKRLDENGKLLIQSLAFRHGGCNYRELSQFSDSLGLKGSNGRKLTQTAVREMLRKWNRAEMLFGSTNQPSVDSLDFLIRESIKSGTFDKFVKLANHCHSWVRRSEPLDFYVAFYSQDGQAYRERVGELVPGQLPLLSLFCEATFDGLSDEFKQHYFAYVIPHWIVVGDVDVTATTRLATFLHNGQTISSELFPAVLEWAVATGDLGLLERLDSLTRHQFQDVQGCLRLLRGSAGGDADAGFDLLQSTLSNRKTKKTLTKLGRLPSVLALLSTFVNPESLPTDKALQAAGLAQRGGKSPYNHAFAMVERAVKYVKSPNDPGTLIAALDMIAVQPFEKWIAGYLQHWLARDSDSKSEVAGLASAASHFDKIGCSWLAAELSGLAGQSKLKSAAKQATISKKLHQQLGTTSLIDLVQPEPPWARTLAAIAGLGGKPSTDNSGTHDDEPTERLIYEISHYTNDFRLEVFHQLRKGSKWSKGRKVALARLYHQYNEAAFAFLTAEDRALCQTLRHWTERGPYGYPEEYCEFETRSGARALIGHPRIYRPGNRDQPLEIIESPPRLVVQKTGGGQIKLSLQPSPSGSSEVRIEKSGNLQIAITFFDSAHHELHSMIGKGLQVPASASAQVVDAMTRLTSLVTVHSEIGDSSRSKTKSTDGDAPTVAAAKKVKGDASLHLHLLPNGDGLRVDFHVHPIGETGPSCHPGEGGSTLFATIDGNAVSAKRDLDAERNNAAAVLDQCPTLASHLRSQWSGIFPTAIEALELTMELETLQQSGDVTLHWPKGKTFQLAGRATESMLRVQIKRDNDWFAASGELKFDRALSLDMMQLIDLVAASPSRFVRLDDGRFLALTQKLRGRLDDLRSFGDGRSAKGKLRFAAVHAGLLEDMGDVKVKSDTHWKNCVERMRKADDIDLQIPTTLQAELRDYQREGVQWMSRLAAWGVGGCLADDMGLGKTLQAIAILLRRAADGPAIVVAPTSVIHNWQDEIARFAPTLTCHVLGDVTTKAARTKLLKSLAAGDVLLCSYGLLQSDSSAVEKASFGTLILDEAQAIKNAATKRSQAAKRLDADCRFILTGTPMENHLGELWNLMDFINPGLLGSAENFQQRFAIPIERDHNHAARQRLKRLIAPFILRRTKSQVLTELPPRTEVTLRIEPSPEEAAFYEAVRQRAIESLAEAAEEGEPKHLQVLGEIMRMRRACCHPKLVLPESPIEGSKLMQTLETIEELKRGTHRALVFSQFVDHLTLVREALDQRQIPYQYLDGSTPQKSRKKAVDAFQSGEGDVFLISLKAGGTGLNLTVADYVIHLDPWWNPAVEDQASDRAHRIGQKRPVTIYRMILAGTIEERILELHATKRDLADRLLEATDQSSKLTTAELLNLIRM